MAHEFLGIHHVTALSGAPLPNLRFYRDVLGLRLVKKTVNFDNPKSYHFYFGDRTGRPGPLITFFPHPVFRTGERGAREVSRTDFAVPAGSLGYWSERLGRAGIRLSRESAFGGRERLSFADQDGTELSVLEEDLSVIHAEPPPGSDVPPERAKDPSHAAAAGGAMPAAPAAAAGDNVMAADAVQLGRALAGTRWRKVAGPHKGFTVAFQPDMGLTTDHSMTGTWAPVAKDRLRISIASNSCNSELLAVGPDGRVLLKTDGQPDFDFLGR
jgi:catechol 2,3-dioxygenase-like lactoylglutathione lyase family enzyme